MPMSQHTRNKEGCTPHWRPLIGDIFTGDRAWGSTSPGDMQVWGLRPGLAVGQLVPEQESQE